MKKVRKPIRTFKDFCESDDLCERAVRTGSILIAANKSRRSGDDAKKAFEAGMHTLRRPVPDGDIEGRLDQIHDAIASLLTGMIHMRQQAGNHLSADVAGHLIATKELSKH